MSTAMTASVWGQGLAAIRLSADAVQLGMQPGDEECHICRDEIPATIAFVPCRHKVCFGCVENLRAKNVFKADKGIKCPFCRRYVDGYSSTRAPSEGVSRFLAEANKAAGVAAAARQAAERKANGLGPQQQQQQATAAAPAGPAARQQQGAGSSSGGGSASGAAGADVTWNCGSCGEKNFFWRDFCGRCKRPSNSSYATDKLSQTRKDLGSVSAEELVGYLHEQGGFCLRKGLRDMGVAIDSHKSSGSVACVREAVAFYGLKRVLHLAHLLSDPATLQAASLHNLGNMGVQRVLEALARLRTAFGPGSGKPQHPEVAAFIASHGGRDPFAAVFAALMQNALAFCTHEKGVYVAQCAANCAANSELVAMANAVFPLALPVCRDARGVFVLLSLLDLFSQRIWDDEANCEPALQAVDLLCKQFTASEAQLVHTGMHALSGKVLVRAIAVAMPRFPALNLAVKCACAAAAMAPTSGGQFTLMELLQLYGHNQEAAEGLRDVVTCMCYSLQGQMGRFATSSDANLHELLLCLVERLGHDQEVGWLDSVIQELVGVLDQLVAGSGTGLEILKFALTQPCLDLDTITSHIADMKGLLSKEQLLPLVGDLMERVASNPPPAAPKYPAASAIQPQLRYLLAQGHPTPLPPPPPPKPGQPGYEEYTAAAAARAATQARAAEEARTAAAARREAAHAQREAAAAAAPAAHSRTSAVMDAWSSLRAGGGRDGGGGSSAAASAWETSAPAGAAAGGSDAWGSGGGGGGGSNPEAWGWGEPAASAARVPLPSVPVAMPMRTLVPVAVPAAAASGRPPFAAPIPQVVQVVPIAVPVAVPAGNGHVAHNNGYVAQHNGWPSAQQSAHMGSGRNNRAAPQPQQHHQQQHHQQQQHQPEWGAPAAPMAVVVADSRPWGCGVCTYEHTGGEAQFLTCAMCGTAKP